MHFTGNFRTPPPYMLCSLSLTLYGMFCVVRWVRGNARFCACCTLEIKTCYICNIQCVSGALLVFLYCVVDVVVVVVVVRIVVDTIDKWIHSRFFGQLLLVGNRTLDGFQEIVLRLQYVIDVVHPFAILFGRLRLQQKTGVAPMRIGAAQLEAILALHRCYGHFIDLQHATMNA